MNDKIIDYCNDNVEQFFIIISPVFMRLITDSFLNRVIRPEVLPEFLLEPSAQVLSNECN